MVNAQEIKKQPWLEKLLQKKAMRSLSGVSVVAILVKPAPCPGECVYCPTERNVPKSYLSNEPAVMRAILFDWDPYAQIRARIWAYEQNGHNTDKIELIIIGGTWSSYPKDYQQWYVKRCFDACNSTIPIEATADEDVKSCIRRLAEEDKGAASLEEAQSINEKATSRIVGMSLETRPDCISWHEIKRMRTYGCTRVETGLQSTDNAVLDLVKRGHNTDMIVKATKRLKDTGYKITYHMMPGLPGATPESDIQGFKDLFSKPGFQPDQVKVYPTVVLENSEMYAWYKDGRYKPYDEKTLFKTLLDIKRTFPPYARIVRLIRDIPTTSIIDGNMIANLREALQKELHKNGEWCKCTRCREARGKEIALEDAQYVVHEYDASDGKEYFLSYTSKDEKTLFAFLRLRIPSWYFDKNDDPKIFEMFPEIKNAAFIRELHTYGKVASLQNKKDATNVQHLGFGKRLMEKAEQIIKEHGINKIAVISGVGVRGYYRKLGYDLEGTYMTKNV